MNWQSFARHADVAAAILVFVIVGKWFTPADWGILPLALGAGAYFLVNRFYPPARG